MANSILLGQYTETNSIFHHLDPRTKLLSMIVIMASFLLLDSFISFAAATILVLVLIFLIKIPLRIFVRGLRPLLFILMFTFIYHALLTKGTAIWSWEMFKVTAEGLQNGTRYVLRIILLVLLASWLTLTTKPLSLAHGLEKLLAPLSKLNLPVEQFALMVVIAIRFVPTITQELDRILLAQKARGYDIANFNPVKRIFAYIPILVPLLFTTIQRAEQLTLAIDARAFGDGKGRTVYVRLGFKPMDFAIMGTAAAFPIILMLLKMEGI